MHIIQRRFGAFFRKSVNPSVISAFLKENPMYFAKMVLLLFGI